MKILVTGAAGFIGSNLSLQLAKRGDTVIGIDNINTYYDPRLKLGRLAECGINPSLECRIVKVVPETGSDGSFVTYPEIPFGTRIKSEKFYNLMFIRMDITDRFSLSELFDEFKPDKVVNLAAQAGVRYSIKNPYAYIESNIVGFMNILECCRHYNVKHLVYASSSSVYGLNDKVPFNENDIVVSPVSIYAATKKANELMSHAYSKLYNIPTTGLRYFTVYGPWGRPDMAPMLFVNAIMQGKEIDVFNNGNLVRDFTYIDDIVNGTIQVLDDNPAVGKSANKVPARVFNIGCSHPVNLMDFIHEIEKNLGMEAKKKFLPMQQGDVYQTNADTTKLENEIGYKPKVELSIGVKKFIDWFNLKYNFEFNQFK